MALQDNQKNFIRSFLVIGAVVLLGLGIAAYQWYVVGGQSRGTSPRGTTPSLTFKRFASEAEFKKYLEDRGDISAPTAFDRMAASESTALDATGPSDLGLAPTRVSGTNVQVAGIDEPDILKTDGKEIFYSQEQINFYWERSQPVMIEPAGVPPSMPFSPAEIKLIKAFPPASLAKDGSILKTGTMLLENKVLVVFSGSDVFGYDVSNPAAPRELWNVKLDNRTRIVTSRLRNGSIYLVMAENINSDSPCPIRPLTRGSSTLEIPCTNIYYPSTKFAVNTTYTVAVLDPADGTTKNSTSFVGSSYPSVVYMSNDALYVTYSFPADILPFLVDFLSTKASDIVPASIIDRMKKVMAYDISARAKFTEVTVIMEEWGNSLSRDEKLRIENEVGNRGETYFTEHLRELQTTDLVKISLDDFRIAGLGSVPGYPLNQFSLDEYKGNLRVATTVGDTEFSNARENDVHVLDGNLKIIGSVQGMGVDERIYSARFIGDLGYVVTFRETDPFYVIDLKDPRNPRKAGELKIPGYSSYLHPISETLILGIGKEDGQVKLSLFDVSNPDNPREASKYLLDEYWSEVLNTQYAFLQDEKHKVFFLPGGQGGYVFSYDNSTLSLVRAVSSKVPRRALYLNDYLYLIGDSGIVVLNENDWTEVNSLDF